MDNLDLFAEEWLTGAMISPYDLMMDLGLPFEGYGRSSSEHEHAIL